MKVEPKDIGAVQDAARLAGFMPYMDKELESMDRVLEARVFTEIDHKTLTPDMALAAWMEKLAIHRLGKRLRQKVEAGVSKGEAIGPAIGR